MAAKTKAAPAGHSAGIYADMTLDGPEIGTLVAVVDRAKNLPNRRTMGKQDPYCAMRLGKEAKKTATDRRGGQTPRWDQELRFTVHESPDYYKLKCSIFNDDKKTDMIGEVWIDLHDLIKPGGGQNDLWHQLNFKGRYAGDIRIELTYYDTRVNADVDADKKLQMERSLRGEGFTGGSALRQLGPREIKRRPLPPGPAHYQSPELPQPPRIQPRHSQPEPIQQQAVIQRQTPPRPALQQHWSAPEVVEDFDYNQIRIDPRPTRSGHSDTFEQQDERTFHAHPEYDPYGQNPYYNNQYPSEQFEQEYERWSDEPAFMSPQSDPSSPFSPYGSSPPMRQSPPALRDQQAQAHRMSLPTNKFASYRDSPLRQSMSQQDVPMLLPASQLPYPTDTEPQSPPPPPPPAHRNSAPRPAALTYNTPPRNSPITMPHSHHTPVEDRSPLQMIEQQYGAGQNSSARSSTRRLSAQPAADPFQEGPALEANQAQSPSIGTFPMPHQLTQNYGVDFMENPVEQDRQGRYIRRNSAVEPQDSPYRLPVRSQTFDTDLFDEHTYRSEPQIVKPRAVSPNARNSVPRKSVSPHPQSSVDRKRLSGVPFGPDSYETLNPGSSSPNMHPRESPDQAKETARQVEVNKLRDQGPIIGNDGRIIDPSDHLPVDTWAPEPERKQRKPEHVINIRRKGGPRPPRSDSSPVSIHTPPANPPLPPKPVPYQNSNPPSPTASGQKRNRLQKQVPSRPLPNQPFPHSHSSPAVPQMRYNEAGQTSPRMSNPSSPHSGPPSRPPLSEYQVPAGANYSPRGSYHPAQQPQYPPTPTKLPPRPQSYAFGAFEDPLAAEMSMIDIGPTRGGGRTAPRPSRGYGGY